MDQYSISQPKIRRRAEFKPETVQPSCSNLAKAITPRDTRLTRSGGYLIDGLSFSRLKQEAYRKFFKGRRFMSDGCRTAGKAMLRESIRELFVAKDTALGLGKYQGAASVSTVLATAMAMLGSYENAMDQVRYAEEIFLLEDFQSGLDQTERARKLIPPRYQKRK
jgi:hypothetical protein